MFNKYMLEKEYHVVWQQIVEETRTIRIGSLDYSFGMSILNIFSNPLKNNGIEKMTRDICLYHNYDQKNLFILNIIKKGTAIKKKRRGVAVDKKNDLS